MIDLPIDVVPGSDPPRFRWRQVVGTPVGPQTVEHEGVLPPSVEHAVASLVGIAKRTAQENALLVAELHLLKEAKATAGLPRATVAGPVTKKKGGA